MDIIHTLVGRGADCCISSDLKMSRSHRYDKKSVYTLAYAIREKSEKNNDSRRKSEKALAYREEKAPSKPRPRLRTPSERSLVMAVRKPSDCVEEGTGRSSSDSGTARDTKTSRSKKKKKGNNAINRVHTVDKGKDADFSVVNILHKYIESEFESKYGLSLGRGCSEEVRKGEE